LDTITKKKSTFKFDLDTPSSAEASGRGFTLGKMFSQGFRKGSDSGGGPLSAFTKKWNEFATAFPAEITILMRYFLLLIGPIATVGSALASILTAAISSVYVAVVGLGAAFAGVFAGIAYGVMLGKKSLETIKDSFPETQKALDKLKNAFEKVDVPTFAEEWEGSLRRFANTLATSLEMDTVAENLGKSASEITNAFSDVLDSKAWSGFVDAIEGPLANAISGLGTGLGSIFSVALQWMTAAAPIAERLGEQFSKWAEGLDKALTKDPSTMQAFLGAAETAIGVIGPLVANLA
jgi:hypothetical protein